MKGPHLSHRHDLYLSLAGVALCLLVGRALGFRGLAPGADRVAGGLKLRIEPLDLLEHQGLFPLDGLAGAGSGKEVALACFQSAPREGRSFSGIGRIVTSSSTRHPPPSQLLMELRSSLVQRPRDTMQPSDTPSEVTTMKKWILALGTCAALSALPGSAFAHGYDAGDATLGGLVGGVVGGLIGAGGVPVYVAPAPVVVAPARPVIVEPYYAPRPVVIERYGLPPRHDRGLHRGWYKHGRPHRHWDD